MRLMQPPEVTRKDTQKVGLALTQTEIDNRFKTFHDTKKGAIETAIKQLLYAIGTKPMYAVDNNDIAQISALVENHVLDEIGIKTCVPYYNEENENRPCYKEQVCQCTDCMFRVWNKNITTDNSPKPA